MDDPLHPAQPFARLQTTQEYLKGDLYFTGTSGLTFRRSFLKDVPPVPEGLVFCADEYLYALAALRAPVITMEVELGRRRLHGKNWYAAALVSPQRLRALGKIRDILESAFAKELAERHLQLAPGHSRRREFEALRDSVLLLALEHKREDASRLVTKAFKGRRLTRYDRFKKATLRIAARSPRFYVWLLEKIYSRRTGLQQLRDRLLPTS